MIQSRWDWGNERRALAYLATAWVRERRGKYVNLPQVGRPKASNPKGIESFSPALTRSGYAG